MIALDDDLLLKIMRPWLQGCPTPVMADAVLLAARQFFELSRAWRHKTDIDTLPGQDEYLLDLPDQSEPSLILAGGRGYDLTLRDQSGSVLLCPAPAQRVRLELVLALMPSRDAQGLPDDAAGRWIEPIAMGAVARLKLTPGYPWSDAQGAALAQVQFKRGWGRASIYAGRSGKAGVVVAQIQGLI